MASFDPTTSDQVWYPYPNFPGYWINSDLEVMGRQDRLVKVQVNDKGYRRLVLRRDGKSHIAYLHHAIAELAYGPRPDGLNVLHWDDDRSNNHPSNLYYGTQKQNLADTFRNGKDNIFRGVQKSNAKLDDDTVRRIRVMIASGMNQKEVGLIVGIHRSMINRIVHGTRWTHVE